jgi:hypothetical protein
MRFAEANSASRSDAVKIAVGFSPRWRRIAVMRRVATLEMRREVLPTLLGNQMSRSTAGETNSSSTSRHRPGRQRRRSYQPGATPRENRPKILGSAEGAIHMRQAVGLQGILRYPFARGVAPGWYEPGLRPEDTRAHPVPLVTADGRCSADFQSAVSQVSNLRGRRSVCRLGSLRYSRL